MQKISKHEERFTNLISEWEAYLIKEEKTEKVRDEIPRIKEKVLAQS